MKKARMVKRILSLVLIIALMAPIFTAGTFASDTPPTYKTAGYYGVWVCNEANDTVDLTLNVS